MTCHLEEVTLFARCLCHGKSEKEGFKRKYFKGNYLEIRNAMNRIDCENEHRGKTQRNHG